MLTTDRLELIPFSKDDLNTFLQINTHPFVRKYLWDDMKIEEITAKEILSHNDACFKDRNWGLWKMVRKQDQLTIGYAGLWVFFDENQPQLIFALLPEFTGQGFAFEASKAVINYSFSVLQFDDVIASTDPPNKASINLCERLGMSFAEEKIIEDKPTIFYKIKKEDK